MKNKKLQPALPGFEKIKRYWDGDLEAVVAKIKPGEFYVTSGEEKISTVVGSCVAACIRDSKLGIGGMNHFMLPLKGSVHEKRFSGIKEEDAARYGNWAMEYLINEILKNGGTRRNLEVKIFGGGQIIRGEESTFDVGRKNIEFVESFVHDDNLRLLASDIGDIYPRAIVYSPSTGAVKVKKIKDSSNKEVLEQEKEYVEGMSVASTEGEVDLF